MEQPLHLIWTHNGKVLRGYDLSDALWKNNVFHFGIGFPGKQTEPKEILLSSSGLRLRSYDILTNVKIRLEADEATLAMFSDWWNSGCGIEISMDGGATYTLLTEDSVSLKASAIGMDAVDGQLGPFDTARLLMRARVPSNFTDYGKIQFQLAVECDVV